jgi:DNA (cytosine-5)-methyltransferase 1
MKHGSLFSGIGGFDLAAEWMGWENVFHCEWMEFPRKVLDYHFPNADSHIDICKTDFKKYANKIDILTGGFPCQPFSLAGKRKGTDDERYLWGEMLRAIQEIKPKYVIAENVFGITNIDGGLVFEQVCLDLEGQGYEVQPFVVPACAKNAPHRRDRCWFIAQNPLFSGCIYRGDEQEGTKVREFGNTCTGSADGIHLSKRDATDTERKRLEGYDREREGFSEHRSYKRLFIGAETKFNATNSNCDGLNKCNGNNEINTSKGRQYAFSNIDQSNGNGDVTNSNKRKQKFTTFNRGMGRIRQFNEKDSWCFFPTQSPVCGGDDGIPTQLDGITFSKWRSESIKGYGNAIVPQIAYQLFEIIQELNENN